MAYFAHAFKKVFVGDTFVTSGKPEDLAAGEYGFFDAKTWEAIPIADADMKVHRQAVLAMGSYHSVDKVGGVGGLKESVKSQVIDPRFVSRFWKVEGRYAQNQMVAVGWDGVHANTTPKFVCGRTYRLRIDVKGGRVLRALGHHFYHVFDVFTGCCADADAPTNVDPLWVFLQFAQQISEHPILSQFLNVTVRKPSGNVFLNSYVPLTDPSAIAAVIGGMVLVVIYEDTLFTDCSVDVLDVYNQEPVVIQSVQLVDEGGDVCGDFEQVVFTQLSAPRAAQGSGMMVFRDFVMSQAYRQEPHFSDARLREAMDMSVMPNVVSLGGVYDTYYILHSVPRGYNPSGVYDRDQYLIQLHGVENVDFSDFVSWVTSYLESAGRGVAIEDFSGA
jgi:hypothetical protein